MFSSFSGSSRRPRNVNLSGRGPTTQNPFAKAVAGTNPLNPQNTIVSAQQNRIARQQERERIQAAGVVQRTWRGYVERRGRKQTQRKLWDEAEKDDAGDDTSPMELDAHSDKLLPTYEREEDCLAQLERLLRFLNPTQEDDFHRLERYVERLRKTVGNKGTSCAGGPWPAAYLRLQDTCLDALARGVSSHMQTKLFRVVHFLIQQNNPSSLNGYYHTLRSVATKSKIDLENVTAPLQSTHPTNAIAYLSFALNLLDFPALGESINGTNTLESLAALVDCKVLGPAVAYSLREKIRSGSDWLVSDKFIPNRLWLLSHFIFFHRHAHGFAKMEKYAPERDFVFVTGTLLSSLVDCVKVEQGFDDMDGGSRHQTANPITPFTRDQLSSLVNQDSVDGALSLARPRAREDGAGLVESGEDTRLLANYILAIMRLFPRRGDEIRMWLYLGSSSVRSDSQQRLPVIRYFWEAASKTRVYHAISQEPRTAIALLKTPPSGLPQRRLPNHEPEQSVIEDQWRVILIFIELYMFVLKVMDDDEFFSGGRAAQDFYGGSSSQKNALLLTEIEDLTLFLKNLGFIMYYNAAEIIEEPKNDNVEDISKLFSVSKDETKTAADQHFSKPKAANVAGIQGMTLDYVKGLVTGLLRAVYERDSRRPFLPKDHWLMTSRFDMTNFIDAVVEEEGRRDKVQEEDDEDESDVEADRDTDDDMDSERSQNLVGTSHAQRTRRIEQLQRQQRKVSRKRYLQSVAPRLEILQNMPFLIPFATRVQIFRRFVHLDRLARRGGHEDRSVFGILPDVGRHHAKIRREHEFEDAYAQFYELGPALKEPIRITFVDQFDTVEAGIDGGGVTKEFLTSVTNQAFAPTDGIAMFVENDHHYLYPNPSAVDEQKELLREAGIEGAEFREQVADLLRRYEFLGRIIGKCLYEGILVDIGFAGFFLVKWALTGGAGGAPRESGYRANLNDLRDFDEGLYQGLLHLKNHPGDVEDFSLNFTITDTLRPATGTRPALNRTLDLLPSGSSTPVTNANRLVYISSITRHRLTTQPHLQTSAFLRGLASIVKPTWLSMFNRTELQTLVGGAAAPISVPDLRANTVYGGVYVVGDDGLEHPSVRLFWQVMEELEESERRKVVRFVTSTPRAPLLGWGTLEPRFSIRDAGADESRLPSTSTCVNLLKLPRYGRRSVLRGKLLQAVNAGAGFDLS